MTDQAKERPKSCIQEFWTLPEAQELRKEQYDPSLDPEDFRAWLGSRWYRQLANSEDPWPEMPVNENLPDLEGLSRSDLRDFLGREYFQQLQTSPQDKMEHVAQFLQARARDIGDDLKYLFEKNYPGKETWNDVHGPPKTIREELGLDEAPLPKTLWQRLKDLF